MSFNYKNKNKMIEPVKCLGKTLINNIAQHINKKYIFNGMRTLYTESSLDLIDYKQARENMRSTYTQDDIDVFKKILRTTSNAVTAAELKKVLHIVEKTDEDLTLLQDSLNRYCSNSIGQEPDYKFGAIVMRTLHYLNEPQIALDQVKNNRNKHLYDQAKTFAILADLLYENGLYKEIRDIYDQMKDEKSVSRLVISIVAMACYKENTPESFKSALELWDDCKKKDPLRRIIVTLAALALNQNAPETAMELIKYCQKTNVISVRTVKIMALCDLGKLNDIELDFRVALRTDGHYLADIVPKLNNVIRRFHVKPDAEICKLFEKLKRHDCIKTQTLEEYISTPIEVSKRPKAGHNINTYDYQLDRRIA